MVTFYKLENGQPTIPVLYLDTLKVSTIEQTAENAPARGGKGNPELIIWDYGKEITVTLEDALFSAKSMAIMFGSVTGEGDAKFGDSKTTLLKTISINDVIRPASGIPYIELHNEKYELSTSLYSGTPTFYDATGATVTADWASTSGWSYAVVQMKVTNASTIEINPNTFPGTYYVTGDTYARSEADGTDEFFQFIIHKAKVQSEVTLTMEAEGDPSTFNMNLKVLRPKSGPMMELVKYDLASGN